MAAVPGPLPTDVAPPSPLGLAAFFLLGALGSLHCLGMCGPLAATYADRASGGSARQTRLQALFNVGRTAGYTAVGGLLGLAGGAVVGAARFAALGTVVRGLVGIAAGLLIVVVGVGYLRSGTARLALPVPAPLGRLTETLVGRLGGLADGPGVVGLGVVHASLPCPLLYPAYAFAFSTGSALAGASALAALGLGTIPMVFVAGTGGAALSAAGPRVQRALGGAFVLLGVFPLVRGVTVLGVVGGG